MIELIPKSASVNAWHSRTVDLQNIKAGLIDKTLEKLEEYAPSKSKGFINLEPLKKALSNESHYPGEVINLKI